MPHGSDRSRGGERVTTALRIGGLCLGVSLWWIAMLPIQGRHGADVLSYSETLEAVSFTSVSTETLRGLGYWLFYIRDPVGLRHERVGRLPRIRSDHRHRVRPARRAASPASP